MSAASISVRVDASVHHSALGALCFRELRQFLLNPIFLFSIALMGLYWSGLGDRIDEIDTVNPYPAIFLGGFGLMAAFWQTRSMHASEQIAGVAPTMLPARTAALCAVAIPPFILGCVTLVAFLQLHPLSDPVYGPMPRSARLAVLIGQFVVPTLGGPLLGVALGRWVRFPGAGFALFLVLYGWVSLVTVLAIAQPASTPIALLRLFAPFSFFTFSEHPGEVTAWRGSPGLFICWQLALCVLAILLAILRGADPVLRRRVLHALWLCGGLAVVLLVAAGIGGLTHPVTA